MPASFDQRVRRARSRSDATFAEPVHVEPEMVGGRARVRADLPDTSIEPFDVIGIFRANAVVNTVVTRPTTTDTADVLAQKATIDFTADQFTAENMPREGWNITLPSRTPVPRYRLGPPRPDKVVRIVHTLTYVGDVP